MEGHTLGSAIEGIPPWLAWKPNLGKRDEPLSANWHLLVSAVTDNLPPQCLAHCRRPISSAAVSNMRGCHLLVHGHIWRNGIVSDPRPVLLRRVPIPDATSDKPLSQLWWSPLRLCILAHILPPAFHIRMVIVCRTVDMLFALLRHCYR